MSHSITSALAAIRTLEQRGYTYTEGVELWKPPLGPDASPLLDEIERLRAQVEHWRTLATQLLRADDNQSQEVTKP